MDVTGRVWPEFEFRSTLAKDFPFLFLLLLADSAQIHPVTAMKVSSGRAASSGCQLHSPERRSGSFSIAPLWNLYGTVGAATMTCDANKNLTSDGVLAMTYDADNRLTDLDKSGVFTQDLVYDWRGRLITKTVTPNGGSAATTRYYYSGWTVLAEVNDSGGATQHRYIPGPGIDNLLADETGGQTYYILQDLLGSTSAIQTHGSPNNVTQRYTYDPYGTPTIRDSAGDPTGATLITNYLYTGREYDKLSGLYNYRHRFYHPGLGRFLQPDPIGFEGGLNFFAYTNGAPLWRIDPFGLDWEYEQRTGRLYRCTTNEDGTTTRTFVETGYSGSGAGLNNPAQEGVRDVGPIPAGSYRMGAGFRSPNTGPMAIPLNPINHNALGRTHLQCHGDNRQRNQTASTGCIVMSRATRDAMNASTGDDRILRVVPGPAPVPPAAGR